MGQHQCSIPYPSTMIIRLFYACIIAGAFAGFANSSSAAQAAESQALVTGAVEKLGGAKRLAEIATLADDGKHKHLDPQEAPDTDVGYLLGGKSRFTLSMDIANGRAR